MPVARRFCAHCAPVTTKPPRSTSTPQPASQPVAGSAPTNRNRLRISTASAPRRREAAAPAHARQRGVVVAFEADHFGVEHQFDVRRRLDALDQIARHAGAEPAAAHHHVDLAGMAGQEHRGLPGGIAAADQHDLLAGAQLRLDRRGPVPDAAALELSRDSRSRAGDSARRSRPRRMRARIVLSAVGREREGAIAARCNRAT